MPTSEMPPAQNCPSLSSAPGICLRNSSLNVPQTSETLTPTFSKTLPRMVDISPPPPLSPTLSSRSQVLRVNLPGIGPYIGLDLFELGADAVAEQFEPLRGFGLSLLLFLRYSCFCSISRDDLITRVRFLKLERFPFQINTSKIATRDKVDRKIL